MHLLILNWKPVACLLDQAWTRRRPRPSLAGACFLDCHSTVLPPKRTTPATGRDAGQSQDEHLDLYMRWRSSENPRTLSAHTVAPAARLARRLPRHVLRTRSTSRYPRACSRQPAQPPPHAGRPSPLLKTKQVATASLIPVSLSMPGARAVPRNRAESWMRVLISSCWATQADCQAENSHILVSSPCPPYILFVHNHDVKPRRSVLAWLYRWCCVAL